MKIMVLNSLFFSFVFVFWIFFGFFFSYSFTNVSIHKVNFDNLNVFQRRFKFRIISYKMSISFLGFFFLFLLLILRSPKNHSVTNLRKLSFFLCGSNNFGQIKIIILRRTKHSINLFIMIHTLIFKCGDTQTSDNYYYFDNRPTRNNSLDWSYNKKLSCLQVSSFLHISCSICATWSGCKNNDKLSLNIWLVKVNKRDTRKRR